MLGFKIEVSCSPLGPTTSPGWTGLSDPVQVPNHEGWGGVGVQNLDATAVMELCDDPGFPSQNIYTLDPGSWYSYTGSQTYWARLPAGQNNPSSGAAILGAMLWINPGGAANIGGLSSSTSGAIKVTEAPSGPVVGPASNPAPGTDWSFTLPNAGRIVALRAVLSCSNVIQSRYPYLYIWEGSGAFKIPMSVSAIHRGNTWEFDGFLSWGAMPFTRTADRVQNFALPDIIWPSGTLVQSLTGNLDVGDQWSAVSMVLSQF